jgi:hypothetical protein
MELALPRLVVRHDLAAASTEHRFEQSARRVVAAALFLCWPDRTGKKGIPTYHGEILSYGGEVLQYLLELGASMNEIVVAGNTALQLVLDDLAAQGRAMEVARGNSEAPKAP